HVQQQNQAAVRCDGSTGKHLQIAQELAQVLDHDFVLAHYVFHHQAHLAPGNIDDHHAEIPVDRLDWLQAKHTVQSDDFSNSVADLGEQLTPDVFDIRRLQPPNLFYERQRQSKHGVTATHEQRLRDDERKRNFQGETRAVALLRLDFDFTIELGQ